MEDLEYENSIFNG